MYACMCIPISIWIVGQVDIGTCMYVCTYVREYVYFCIRSLTREPQASSATFLVRTLAHRL